MIDVYMYIQYNPTTVLYMYIPWCVGKSKVPQVYIYFGIYTRTSGMIIIIIIFYYIPTRVAFIIMELRDGLYHFYTSVIRSLC